jgi:hypothetical protein
MAIKDVALIECKQKGGSVHHFTLNLEAFSDILIDLVDRAKVTGLAIL